MSFALPFSNLALFFSHLPIHVFTFIRKRFSPPVVGESVTQVLMVNANPVKLILQAFTRLNFLYNWYYCITNYLTGQYPV